MYCTSTVAREVLEYRSDSVGRTSGLLHVCRLLRPRLLVGHCCRCWWIRSSSVAARRFGRPAVVFLVHEYLAVLFEYRLDRLDPSVHARVCSRVWATKIDSPGTDGTCARGSDHLALAVRPAKWDQRRWTDSRWTFGSCSLVFGPCIVSTPCGLRVIRVREGVPTCRDVP